MMILVFDLVENIFIKEENASYHYFFPFPTMFSKSIFVGVIILTFYQTLKGQNFGLE